MFLVKTLNGQITAACKRAKLTQAVLSAKAGISQGDISSIERGQVDARLSTIFHIYLKMKTPQQVLTLDALFLL